MFAVTNELRAWIADLDDDYIADWANRGLLRRGRKLAATLTDSDLNADEHGVTAAIEGHRQRLSAPGFEHLACSCPAAGPCHHLSAFLLRLQAHPALATTVTEVSPPQPPPWLAADGAELEKLLGKTHLRRAWRLLGQATPVTLEENNSGWVVGISERQAVTVRIPRSAGIAAATCTCGADRCQHRALAVLWARRQTGVIDAPAQLETLSQGQRETVGRLQDWLRELLVQGCTGGFQGGLEHGAALATLARQTELPRLAAAAEGLVELQKNELASLSFVQTGHFRARLAELWMLLRALNAKPLPRPLIELAGVHKRDYHPVQELELIGVGAEVWNSPTGYAGLTLHLYAPDDGHWYQLSEVRGAAQRTGSGWSPQDCWLNESWGRTAYHDMPGATLCLRQGWVAKNRRLSTRPGTVVELIEGADSLGRLPRQTDFAALARDYGRQLTTVPVAPAPAAPVILEVGSMNTPRFDTLNQRWSQTIFDLRGCAVEIEIAPVGDHTAAAQKKLGQIGNDKQRGTLIFGLPAHRGRTLLLRPLSIRTNGDDQWIHLTLI